MLHIVIVNLDSMKVLKGIINVLNVNTHAKAVSMIKLVLLVFNNQIDKIVLLIVAAYLDFITI